MKRNKYINTFNTTAEYDNYIESAAPEFPNVALTKDDGEVHYMRISPNDYTFLGITTDNSTIIFEYIIINNVEQGNYSLQQDLNGNNYTTDNLKLVDNTDYYPLFKSSIKSKIKTIKKFKIDTSSTTSMAYLFSGCSSLTSLDLSTFDTSNVTNMNGMFASCSSLTSLDLSTFDTSNVTNMNSMFSSCNSLTDVYITVEATLMKLTNNLTSQGNRYIPSNNGKCTIHYNDVDYKWQNNAWTPQS